MKNNIHLTINTYPETSVSTSSWVLDGDEFEPERIAIKFKNKEYMVVLSDNPFFEIWSLDSDGELDNFEQKLSPDDQVKDLLDSVGIKG